MTFYGPLDYVREDDVEDARTDEVKELERWARPDDVTDLMNFYTDDEKEITSLRLQ